jgi:hypothetical protein
MTIRSHYYGPGAYFPSRGIHYVNLMMTARLH